MILKLALEKKLQNLQKLSRWIRCIFQLAIGNNTQAAEEVLDQAYILARDAPDDLVDYPQEELEWLSTTAFNRAIDFYLASDDAATRRWYNKALDLARLLNDNGSLWHTLQMKFGKLSWDG